MKKTRNRIKSIDFLRGLVMILMALDHVRDYFHADSFLFDPTDVGQTNLAIFFTRFVTHYCAPVFIFLAGTSAFFVGQKITKKELSIWLLKRGIWLIIVELTIIKLAWLFQLDYTAILLQVIWALGISMIFLAAVIHLPKRFMIIMSLLVVAGHNAFDWVEPGAGVRGVIWTFLHIQNIIPFGDVIVFVGYPMIPWIFVMVLGYYFGTWYLDEVKMENRIQWLKRLGWGSIIGFFVLRALNVYGDLYPWEFYDTIERTVISFFNVTKYPPSLQYLLIMLGPSFLILAYSEKWQGKWFDRTVVYGRVPMFFYIIHIYVIHGLAVGAAIMTGFSFSDMQIDLWVTMQPELQGYGFSLGVVYLVWIAVCVGLYPLNSWYNDYKSNNRDKWWLSYF